MLMRKAYNNMNYYIFGAHSRGYTLFEYLRVLEPQSEIKGFLYDNDENNPTEIEGVSVINIAGIDDLKTEIDVSVRVYVATQGIHHSDIFARLSKLGFSDIIRVTPELDTKLRNRYVEKSFCENGRSFIKIDAIESKPDHKVSEGEVKLYIAKTASDNSFSEKVELHDYESIIQVGCDLTEIRLPEADYYDDLDAISERNSQFCELSALYWIWKHATQDIIGLEHWRRRFILPDNWSVTMQDNDIDVILPVPLCVMPSILENYKSRHDTVVWYKGMDILKKHHPEDYDNACRYFADSKLYSPCNMIIVKREVLLEYCEWLFPVLLELNDTIGILDDIYQNRYPGFIAERLLNFFFEKNRDRFRIIYADKSFLS